MTFEKQAVNAAINAMEPGTPVDVGKLDLPDDVAKAVEKAIRPRDAVRELFRSRLETSLRRHITQGSLATIEDVFAADGPPPRSSAPLPEAMRERVAKLVARVRCIAKVNRLVHCEVYNNIIQGHLEG